MLWIPLRRLKGKERGYPLETLLYEEYFKSYPEDQGKAFGKALCRKMQVASAKTLLILDVWNEIVQEEGLDCLEELINYPRVIITSRPYGVPSHTINDVDLELETLGFSQENIISYLNHRSIVEKEETAKAIQTVIQKHVFVRAFVNIPIQLDALCYSWDEIDLNISVLTP